MKRLTKAILVSLLAMHTLSTNPIMAQPTQKPTLEDLIPGGETYRRAKTPYLLKWWGDVCVNAQKESLKSIDPKTKKETTLATLEEVNNALKEAKLTTLSDLRRAQLCWPNKEQMLLQLPAAYALYNWALNRITQTQPLPEEALNIDYQPQSGNIAYTLKNNLYVNQHAVTNEPEGIVCGQSVHRNEFGISKGTFWSPNGEQLAFYRMNESMVTPYPIVDIAQRIALVEKIRYPMAGMLSHQVKVGIYHPASQQTIYLNTGDPTNRYFTNIAWAPNGKSLYLVELNRDQNHARLCQYNAQTGELMATLYEEEHPKYVEPQHPITFLPWDDSKFIYHSQRDGYNHLYLFDTNTAVYPETHQTEVDTRYRQFVKATQLTQGPWLVKEILGFNTAKKELVFTATKASPLQNNLYKVSIANQKITPLDNTAGVHTAQLSASGHALIDSHTSPSTPRSLDLIEVKNGKTHHLCASENPHEGLEMPSIEVNTIKAADGKTDLYYRLVKPTNFDPTKQYPAIVYVYGGPHAQMISNSWQYGARGWDLYMANKGYVVFTLDNRGSSNRGLEFENATFARLGIEEGKDQIKGAEFLKSLSYVDPHRIGVHGWSFGGHVTTALMLRYPETFKVGVAGGPVIDWAYYEVMYGERYMDTPQTNPEGYDQCNLNKLAGNLKGRLLMIHDDSDKTCVLQHTLSFIKACVDARTYPDLFIYPRHDHNVMGRDRVHLYEKVTRYFEDYL